MTQANALYRAALKGLVASISFGRAKGKARGAALVVGLVMAMFLYFSITYNVTMAPLLASLGVTQLLFGILGVLAALLCALLQAGGAKGMLFATADMDVLLALPVKPFRLLGARLAALYTQALVLVATCMLPTLVFYWVYAGVSVLVLARVVVACLALACLPVAISLVLGYLLALVASMATRKALMENLMYFGFIGLLVVAAVAFPRAMDVVTQIDGEALYSLLGSGLPLIVWLADFVGAGSGLALVKLLLLCAAPLAVLGVLCSLRYGRILAGLTTHSAKSDYTLGALRLQSAKRALLKKELKRYLNTPIWLFNTTFGPLVLLVAGGASVVLGGKIDLALQQMELQNMPLVGAVAAVLAFSLGLTNVSASSVSLEGKQLQVLRSLPITARDILAPKLVLHLLVAAPPALASVVLFCIGLRLGVRDGLVLAAVALLLSWLTAAVGLVLNLHLPKMDTSNDAAVVKQSAAVAVSLLCSVATMLLLGVVWVKIGESVCLAVLACLCCLAQGYLHQSGARLLCKIEL